MNIFYFLGGIVLLVPAVVFLAFAILRNQKNKQGIWVRERKPEPESGTRTVTEEKVEEKKWYAFLTTQQWVDIENLLLFIGNLIFAVACYLLLPGFLRQHWLYSWSHSALLVVVSAFILSIIGVFYYFYDPKGPSSRKKSYILLNTVGVIFCLLISWHDVTFFDPAGKALAKVNKDGVVSEVLFTDASRSPITGRELRDITSDDVPQAQRFVTTGADIVRWIPLVGKHVSPPPPPPPPPPLLKNPCQIYIKGGEPLKAGEVYWVTKVKGTVCSGSLDDVHKPAFKFEEGFRYKNEIATDLNLGMSVLIEKGDAQKVVFKWRKEGW